MPFICIYIHFVWTTKYRQPFLESSAVQGELWKHIRINGRKKGIHVDHVGGWIDHCHCLVSLNNTQSPDMIMQLLKGESSHYVNHNLLENSGFAWQDGYYAAAVQFDRVPQVRYYIKNQMRHHSHQTFTDEYEAILLKSGFQKTGDIDFS